MSKQVKIKRNLSLKDLMDGWLDPMDDDVNRTVIGAEEIHEVIEEESDGTILINTPSGEWWVMKSDTEEI
jgi:hypothetical protein